MSHKERADQPLSTLRIARKIVVLVIGGTVLAIGVALIVLPGPAVVVIPAGLAILATEFLWARKLLRHLKARAFQILGKPTDDEKGACTQGTTVRRNGTWWRKER
ncbi:MAG: PGPGW domain-containing protein [Acidobacteria bacterium]|nr:PGPGW domain-containing protein [Acidobacteriota bacterium]